MLNDCVNTDQDNYMYVCVSPGHRAVDPSSIISSPHVQRSAAFKGNTSLSRRAMKML